MNLIPADDSSSIEIHPLVFFQFGFLVSRMSTHDQPRMVCAMLDVPAFNRGILKSCQEKNPTFVEPNNLPPSQQDLHSNGLYKLLVCDPNFRQKSKLLSDDSGSIQLGICQHHWDHWIVFFWNERPRQSHHFALRPVPSETKFLDTHKYRATRLPFKIIQTSLFSEATIKIEDREREFTQHKTPTFPDYWLYALMMMSVYPILTMESSPLISENINGKKRNIDIISKIVSQYRSDKTALRSKYSPFETVDQICNFKNIFKTDPALDPLVSLASSTLLVLRSPATTTSSESTSLASKKRKEMEESVDDDDKQESTTLVSKKRKISSSVALNSPSQDNQFEELVLRNREIEKKIIETHKCLLQISELIQQNSVFFLQMMKKTTQKSDADEQELP